MEAEHLNHNSTVSNTVNSDLTKEFIQDSNIKSSTMSILESVCNDFENIDIDNRIENRSTKDILGKVCKDFESIQVDRPLRDRYTKNILESICNDFENIEVDTPKENWYTNMMESVCSHFENLEPDILESFGSNIENVEDDTPKENRYTTLRELKVPSGFVGLSESNQIDINNSLNDENEKSSSDEVAPSVNSQNQNSEDEDSNKDVQVEMLPLQDSAKVWIIPENFSPEKNLSSSSVAELADAELVRTRGNSVSVIVANPYFKQVAKTESSDIPADTSDIVLNNNKSSEKRNMNENTAESPLTDYSLQKTNTDVDSHPEVSHEIIYANDVAESSDIYNSPHSSTPTIYLSKKERNETYFRSRAELGRVTKARRITAKLKTEWAKKLVESGFLMCPMFGCFQKYRTIANFITHYKHCCCGTEKVLKHCPYCASVIFSSSKAVLHHMKVEHPERLEEYKASYPEPQDMHENFDVSDEDNSRLVEATQRDKFVRSPKKHKFLAKESRLSPKTRILKHKIKTRNESVIKNSKIKECGHFDKIISRISSVNDKTNTLYADGNKISKAAEKYFEEERDAEMSKEEHSVNHTQEKEEVNTKSRLVLNMNQYKRYSQYLTVTRDWASHRRTYSRPKNSDSVLDSSNLVNMQNESSELDIHQLNSSLESSSISLSQNEPFSLSQSICDRNLSTEISSFEDSLESNINFTNKKSVENTMQKDSITDTVVNNKINDVSSETIAPERRPCYLNQSNIVSKSTPLLKSDVICKQSMRIAPIITYGKVPDSLLKKSDEKRPPVIDFDSFVKNSLVTQKGKNISKKKKVSNSVKPAKHNKEDGIKQPHNESLYQVKRKRGRPRKVNMKDNSGICEKEIVRQKMLQSKTGLKTCNKLIKRINSKIDSSFQQKKRMKLSVQARYSLKKAIMCGVKRSVDGGTFHTIRKKSLVHGKSSLKSVKCVQENKNINFSIKTSEASDHNNSTDASMHLSHTDGDINNCFQNDVEVQGGEILCMSSKIMEGSKLQKENIILSSQSVCLERGHSDIHGCITDDSHSSPLSHTLRTPENISKPNSNTNLDCIPSVPDLDKPLDSTTPVLMKQSRGRLMKNNIHKPVEINVQLPELADSSPSVSTSGAVQKHDDKVREDTKVDGELEKTKHISEKHQEVQEGFPVSTHSCTYIHFQKKKKDIILPLKKKGETDEIGIKNNSVCFCWESTVQMPTKEASKRKVAFEAPVSCKIRASIPVNLQTTISHSGENKSTDVLPKHHSAEKLAISQHSFENSFLEFKPDLNKFEFCNGKYEEHLKTKIHIKIDNSPDWIKLKCFESITHEGSNKATFFVGGPVQSSAFCPTPRNKIVNQYIAVASSHTLFNRHSYTNTKSFGGFIQFWNLGCLHENLELKQVPSMELAIYHTHGLISQMKWCPKECYDAASKRLGLLALSCSDGFVRIYSIPQPNLMPKRHSNGTSPVYCTSPSVMLTPLFGGPCSATRKSMATCIDWHKNGQQIAAGFGNGTICLWMLKTSTLVSKYDEKGLLHIQPYKIFQAGGTPVTSIAFAPLMNCRWLVCSSFDKTLRFFDLYDTCIPFCTVKRGFAFNCEWAKDFCGAYVSLYDGILFKGSTFAKECGMEELPVQNVSGSVTSLTCSSISSITNAQAIADMTGAVFLNFIRNLYDQAKVPCDDFTHVILQTQVVALDLKENCTETNTHEVVSVINEMENIVDVIDSLVSNCETQTANASVHSDSTSSITKMPATKNVAESIKENHYCKSDATTLETVVELELEDKSIQETNKKLLNDLIESIAVKESEKNSFQELLDSLIESVVTKESEENSLQELLNNLIESVVIKEYEEKYMQETNKNLLYNLIESVVMKESEEKSLLKTNKELLASLIESVVTKESKEKSLLETNKKLLAYLIKSVVTEESKEKSLLEINKKLLNSLIELVVIRESEEKALQESNKELLDNLIESIVMKESEEKSLQESNTELLDNIIESVVMKEPEEKPFLETNKELFTSQVLLESFVTKESEENSLQKAKKMLHTNLIESVVTKESKEKSLLETNEKLLNSLIEMVVRKESEEKSVL
ncbi:general transcription factor 3C polypeptide 2, partial [Trichonephila inaurata madagascariensis]